MAQYVILQPYSLTNQSSDYKVVWDEDWIRYSNGVATTLAYAGRYDTYNEAQQARDDFNARLKTESR